MQNNPKSFISNNYKSIIKDIIAISSISSPPFEERKKIEYLKSRLGIFSQLKNITIDKEDNLSMLLPGKVNKNILLVAHTDTALKLETNPIYKEGKYLHGHGVCDNTAGVTSLLYLLKFLNENKITPHYNLLFLFTVGEEGIGGKRGMKYFLKHNKNIDVVINAESHDVGRITVSVVGQFRAKIAILCEKGGHSWRDFGNSNPVAILGTLIYQLQQSKLFKKKETTYTFSLIEGGQSINAIPTSASVMYEFRSLSSKKYQKVHQFFDAVLKKIEKQYADCTIKIDVINDAPPVSFNPNHPLIKFTESIHKKLHIKSFYKDSNTDGDVSLNLKIPTVTIGTSNGYNTHSIHEYVEINSFKQGYLQLFQMIVELQSLKL